MCAKGQGLGKERERSLQDIRDVFGFATKTRSFSEMAARVEGHEGMLGGKKNPGQAKPPKRVREASRLILKNTVNGAKEWLSLITDHPASCIPSPAVSHH